MGTKAVVLQSDCLEVRVLLPGTEYRRSRYDWSGIVEQVTLNGRHTFLSRERFGDGEGLGGIGLAGVFEWSDSALYEETAVADVFPLIGVGLLRRPDSSPFFFAREYAVRPFMRESFQGEEYVEFHTFPSYCRGMAAEQWKRLQVKGDTLTITNTVTNVGVRQIEATEFCHNFFQLDQKPVDEKYRLEVPYPLIPKMRRGELIVGGDYCRPGRFDAGTGSTAFVLREAEKAGRHWMRLSHEETGTGVWIGEDVPVSRFYGWSNVHAFCPETFVTISLKPGETMRFSRTYRFTAEKESGNTQRVYKMP